MRYPWSLKISVIKNANSFYDEDTAIKVGQEIDRQQLRFSELLLVLAGGTIGIIAAFMIRVEPGSFSFKWLLVIGLALLSVSVLLAFIFLIFFIMILIWNYHYRVSQFKDKKTYIDRLECDDKQKYWKKLSKWILGFQSSSFVVGELLIILFMFFK